MSSLPWQKLPFYGTGIPKDVAEVRCYFALCACFGSARNLHLEVFDDAEVLQEAAGKVWPNWFSLRKAGESDVRDMFHIKQLYQADA